MFGIAPKIRLRRTDARAFPILFTSAVLFAFAVLVTSAPLVGAAPAQARIKPPPSAELSYSVKAKQSGLTVKGDSMLRWTKSGNKYVVTTETNAMMFGKILDTRSEGMIEPTGLAPTRFTERRYRKQEAVTRFSRADKTVTYAESQKSYPLKGDEQDRASIIWQLISVARAHPASFKPGSEWTFTVVGRRHIEPWTFKVIKAETLETPLGKMQALQVTKVASQQRDQEIDLWLAPSLEWYPVQLRMSERDGATIEQTLQKVTPRS